MPLPAALLAALAAGKGGLATAGASMGKGAATAAGAQLGSNMLGGGGQRSIVMPQYQPMPVPDLVSQSQVPPPQSYGSQIRQGAINGMMYGSLAGNPMLGLMLGGGIPAAQAGINQFKNSGFYERLMAKKAMGG